MPSRKKKRKTYIRGILQQATGVQRPTKNFRSVECGSAESGAFRARTLNFDPQKWILAGRSARSPTKRGANDQCDGLGVLSPRSQSAIQSWLVPSGDRVEVHISFLPSGE